MQNVENRRQDGFKRPRLDVAQCLVCKGRAVVKGVFYELVCTDCNGSGWVIDGSRLVLPLEDLVTQLSFKLQAAEKEIRELRSPGRSGGAERYYNESNRRGAGETNFTGD